MIHVRDQLLGSLIKCKYKIMQNDNPNLRFIFLIES